MRGSTGVLSTVSGLVLSALSLAEPALADTRTAQFLLSNVTGTLSNLIVDPQAGVSLASLPHSRDGAAWSGTPWGSSAGSGIYHGVAYQGSVYALAYNNSTGAAVLNQYLPPAPGNTADPPTLVNSTPVSFDPNNCYYPDSLALIGANLYVSCHSNPNEVVYQIALPSGAVTLWLNQDVIPAPYDLGYAPLLTTDGTVLYLTRQGQSDQTQFQVVTLGTDGTVQATLSLNRPSVCNSATVTSIFKYVGGNLVMQDASNCFQFFNAGSGALTQAWGADSTGFDIAQDGSGNYWIGGDPVKVVTGSGTVLQSFQTIADQGASGGAIVTDGRYVFFINESSTSPIGVIDSSTMTQVPRLPGSSSTGDSRNSANAQVGPGFWNYQGFVPVQPGQVVYLGRPDNQTLMARAMGIGNGYAPSAGPAMPPPLTGLPARLESIARIAPSTSEPPDTSVLWQVSGDQGGSWVVWDGSAWIASRAPSMSTAALAAVPASAWQTLGGSSVLLAMTLTSADVTVTPQVFRITATIQLPEAPTIGAITCPGELYPSAAVQCTATVTAPSGTLTYAWQATSGTITANGTQLALKAASSKPGSGVITVSLTAGLQENEAVSTTGTATITVEDYPLPSVDTLTCPASLFVTQSGQCSASASAQAGTLQWRWSATAGALTPGADSAMPLSASLVSALPGTITVSFQASILEQPERQVTSQQAVVIQDVQVTGSLSCPSTLLKNTGGTCRASFSTPYGDLRYQWNVSPGVTFTSGDDLTTVQLLASAIGNATVSITVKNTLVDSAVGVQTATVAVTGWQPPGLTILGPTRMTRHQAGTFSAVTSVPPNLPAGVPTEVLVTWSYGTQSGQGASFTAAFETLGAQTLRVTAQFVAANGDPGATATVPYVVTVKGIPKPTLSVSLPRNPIAGYPVTLSAVAAPGTRGDTTPIHLVWTLPDQSQIEANSIQVTVATPGMTSFTVQAWQEGFTAQDETATQRVAVLFRQYVFPSNLALHAQAERNLTAPLAVSYTLAGDFRNSTPGIFTYLWDPGDGTTPVTSAFPRRSYLYAAPGQYQPRVTVTDQFGHTQTLPGPPITVLDPPPLSVGVTARPGNQWTRAPVSISFTPVITGGSKLERVKGFQWFLGDRLVGTSQFLAYKFTDPGSYQLRLVVTTTSQQQAVAVPVTVKANQPPTCRLTQAVMPPPARPVTVKITATCTKPDGRITGYTWDWGDLKPITNQTFVTRWFTQPGTWTVVLTVKDEGGGLTQYAEQVQIAQ